MQTRVNNRIAKEFTITPNAMIQDRHLKPESRALFSYMASKPEDWIFRHDELEDNMGWSDKTLAKYINQLIDTGWLQRDERRTSEGTFDGFNYVLNATCSTARKIFPGGRNSDLTNKEPPLIGQKEKNLWPVEITPLAEAPEERVSQAVSHVRVYLRANPTRWKEIADSALNRLTAQDFLSELTVWAGHYASDRKIMQSPVTALTAGAGNFIGWLSRQYCREKYLPKQPRPSPSFRAVPREEAPGRYVRPNSNADRLADEVASKMKL